MHTFNNKFKHEVQRSLNLAPNPDVKSSKPAIPGIAHIPPDNNDFHGATALEGADSRIGTSLRSSQRVSEARLRYFRRNRDANVNRVLWPRGEEISGAGYVRSSLRPDDRISVIIVSYNCGNLLVECVRSVFASNIPVHVIVCDNCSTDLSVATLAWAFGANPNLTIIQNPGNLGFARACNLGFARATGRYALFLNPDCKISADTLQRMVAAMDRETDVGMAGCLITNPDGTEQRGCRRRIPTPWSSLVYATELFRLFGSDNRFRSFNLIGSPIPEKPTEVEAISGAFMLIKTQAIDAVGFLDEGYFLHCEDLDWCIRFQRAGYKILFVPDVEIIHAKGASSKNCRIRVEWHKHRGMLRFFKKHFRQRYPFPVAGLVTAGVWLRFAIQSLVITLRPAALSEGGG